MAIGVGPWVSAQAGNTLTITALGDQTVPNNAYTGPSATTAPYNQKTISVTTASAPHAPAAGDASAASTAIARALTERSLLERHEDHGDGPERRAELPGSAAGAVRPSGITPRAVR